MVRGRAKLAVSTGLSVWVLDAPDGFGDGDFHAHHAIQITVCFEGALTLIERDRTTSGNLLAVAPDHAHRLEARGVLGIVFVEPESSLGRHLMHAWFDGEPLVEVDEPGLMRAMAPLHSAIDDDLGREAMLKAARDAVGVIAPAEPLAAPDARVQRIVDYAMLHTDVSLDDAAVAAGVHLSGSRLRHLFVEHTGLAFKTYMLWQRLVLAVGLYSQGRTLTEAAHEAGFADSAHFSRAFRRTFGAPATTLRRF